MNNSIRRHTLLQAKQGAEWLRAVPQPQSSPTEDGEKGDEMGGMELVHVEVRSKRREGGVGGSR